MTSFLNKKKKSPEQSITTCLKALEILSSSSTANSTPEANSHIGSNGIDVPLNDNSEETPSIQSTISKSLVEIKHFLIGEPEHPMEIEESKIFEVSRLIQSTNLIILLIESMSNIPFEARKDIAIIVNNLIKKNPEHFHDYFLNNVSILIDKLIDGYYHNEIALHCGLMLREAIKLEGCLQYILLSTNTKFWLFLDIFIHLPNFDIASDAFNIMKDILTTSKYPHVVVEFFEIHGLIFISKYIGLLKSENYVTQRRSLKLLSELLLDRNNYTLMMSFISSKENLKIIMNLLRNKSSHIQFETFHVFKIFVANPMKTKEIVMILYNNKQKLIQYLLTFQNDREDIQFIDEKKLLIETLEELHDPEEKLPSKSVSPLLSSEDNSLNHEHNHEHNHVHVNHHGNNQEMPSIDQLQLNAQSTLSNNI